MSPENLRGRRILIVEDEIMIAMMLENALSDAGCDVVGTCATVQEAQTMLKERSGLDLEELDGAILDINLRGECSFGLARELMAQQIPLIMVSGYTPEIVPHDVHVEFFHEKPFQSAAILRSLSDAIRTQHAGPQAA